MIFTTTVLLEYPDFNWFNNMIFPTVFLNHGGGPYLLLGKQPSVAQNIKETCNKFADEKPEFIVVVSAHWEANPISISSSQNPRILYDYYGFPPETYKYKYDAPGSPTLAMKIQRLLNEEGLESRLDDERGFDHGVFIPMMLMYPDADIPIVCVSLHSSLSVDINVKLGRALAPLRKEKVLVVGSGYTFHNLTAFFNTSLQAASAAASFNNWLKATLLTGDKYFIEELKMWESAPSARFCHPREEHLLPLMVVAAAAGDQSKPELLHDSTDDFSGYAISSYIFR